MRARSLPPVGSVVAMPRKAVPAQTGGRTSRFASSVPWTARMWPQPASSRKKTAVAMEKSPRPTSSAAISVRIAEAPMPPYSVGTGIARSPRWAISARTSSGIRPSASILRSFGRSTRSPNFRTAAWKASSSSVSRKSIGPSGDRFRG